jgi:hypothetical protein
MQDAITAVINSSDVQGKYLDVNALGKLKTYFQTGAPPGALVPDAPGGGWQASATAAVPSDGSPHAPRPPPAWCMVERTAGRSPSKEDSVFPNIKRYM